MCINKKEDILTEFLDTISMLKNNFSVDNKPVKFKWAIRDYMTVTNRGLVTDDPVNGLREIGSIKIIEGGLARTYFERYKRVLSSSNNTTLKECEIDDMFQDGPETVVKERIKSQAFTVDSSGVDVTTIVTDEVKGGLYTRCIYCPNSEQLVILAVWTQKGHIEKRCSRGTPYVPRIAPEDEVKAFFLNPKLFSLITNRNEDLCINTELDRTGFILKITDGLSNTLCTVNFSYGDDIMELVEILGNGLDDNLVERSEVVDGTKGSITGFLIDTLIPKGITFGFEYHRNTVTDIFYYNNGALGARWVLHNRDLGIFLVVSVGSTVC